MLRKASCLPGGSPGGSTRDASRGAQPGKPDTMKPEAVATEMDRALDRAVGIDVGSIVDLGRPQ